MCESTLADARLLFSGSNKIPPQVQRQGKLLLPGQVNLRGLYGWLRGGYAEVAVLKSKIQEQQTQIEELKRKLEHMNEVFANAQRAQYGQSSEKKTYVLNEDQMNFFN